MKKRSKKREILRRFHLKASKGGRVRSKEKNLNGRKLARLEEPTDPAKSNR